MIALLFFFILSVVALMVVLTVPQRLVSPLSGALGIMASLALCLSSLTVFFSHFWLINLWTLSSWGLLRLGEDRLSSYFLLVASMVFLAVAWYSPGYLRHLGATYNLRHFAVVYHTLMMAVVLTLLAQDVLSFLIAWEVMSIISYFAVNFEDLNERNTRAGYIMLGASEAGFLIMLGAWLPLITAAHSIDFAIIAHTARYHLAPDAEWMIMLCSFFGFGVKAGLFPSMSWLPRAHPAAPANTSAILSGVILNLGLYGIILVNSVLLPVSFPAQGLLVLGIGSVTALLGILYASTENHLKRMLAHSSIENMGLITVALGAALTFQATHLPTLAFIAWVAALYQMLNHSIYKSLLFLNAGAVDLATGDLEMNHLGGLARVMPWTALLTLFGVMSIAALPPFSGFISEWLILQTLLRSVSLKSPVFQVMFALSGVIVALTAGLAATAFIKFYGMTFLGPRRSQTARQIREVDPSLRWAMATLAALSLALGLIPTYVVRFLSPLVATLGGHHHLAALVPAFFEPHTLPPSLVAAFKPLGAETGRRILPGPGLVIMHQSSATMAPHVVFASAPFYLAITIILFLGILYGGMRVLLKKRTAIRSIPWQGGVSALPPTAHYTATGFSNPIRVIFRAILSPSHSLDQEILVENHFHVAVRRTPHDSYVIDRVLFYPVVTLAMGIAKLLARMHHGNINNYIFYAFVTLLLAMVLSVLI